MRLASSSSHQLLYIPLALIVGAAVISTGCGGGGSPPNVVSAAAPSIVTQPTNQTTRVGQSATFTVNALGTTPFTYQWAKNGAPISGGISASYMTPPAVAADSGAVFTVTVTNAISYASSKPATLTVGPRAPALGDWRFQGIDQPGPDTFESWFNILVPQTETYTNQLGIPIMIGAAPGICYPGIANDCSWGVGAYSTPSGVTGLTTYYRTDSYGDLESDLDNLNNSNTVITGLDLESANQCFAISYLQVSQASGFTFTRQWVAPDNVQSIATQLGQGSQVITALSYDAGQVYVFSYSWQGDKTVYEVSVVSATSDTYVAQATGLAQAGYIITAIGGDPTDGLLLVGTRVLGDSMPRPMDYEDYLGVHGSLPANIQTLYRDIFASNPNSEVWFNEQ